MDKEIARQEALLIGFARCWAVGLILFANHTIDKLKIWNDLQIVFWVCFSINIFVYSLIEKQYEELILL